MAETNTGIVKRLTRHRWNKPIVWDVLFVLVFPITCLLLDPGIITAGPLALEPEPFLSSVLWPGLLSQFQLPLYLSILLLILGFWLSFLQNLPDILNSALRGVVFLGLVLSGLFVLMMLPLGYFAVIVFPPLAPFGSAPALTAWRYYRRYRDMGQRASESPGRKLGFFTGIVAPVAAAVILYVGVNQMQSGIFPDLRSDDPVIVSVSLETLASDPFCLSNCRSRVVWQFCRGQLAVSTEQFMELFGDKVDGKVLTDGTCDIID